MVNRQHVLYVILSVGSVNLWRKVSEVSHDTLYQIRRRSFFWTAHPFMPYPISDIRLLLIPQLIGSDPNQQVVPRDRPETFMSLVIRILIRNPALRCFHEVDSFKDIPRREVVAASGGNRRGSSI